MILTVPQYYPPHLFVGFIRGIKLVRTSDIPFLNPTEVSEVPTQGSSSKRNTSSSSGSGSGRRTSELSNFSVGPEGLRPPLSTRSDKAGRSCQGGESWPQCGTSNGEEDGEGLQEREQQPMFDPKVIDMDASTILR